MPAASRTQATEPADLRDVPVPPCRLVANDNAREWDGDLPYEFDSLTQAVVDYSRARGGLEQHQVARIMGVTRQRVQQIEDVALRKLRKRHGPWLKAFLEDLASHRR